MKGRLTILNYLFIFSLFLLAFIVSAKLFAPEMDNFSVLDVDLTEDMFTMQGLVMAKSNVETTSKVDIEEGYYGTEDPSEDDYKKYYYETDDDGVGVMYGVISEDYHIEDEDNKNSDESEYEIKQGITLGRKEYKLLGEDGWLRLSFLDSKLDCVTWTSATNFAKGSKFDTKLRNIISKKTTKVGTKDGKECYINGNICYIIENNRHARDDGFRFTICTTNSPFITQSVIYSR